MNFKTYFHVGDFFLFFDFISSFLQQLFLSLLWKQAMQHLCCILLWGNEITLPKNFTTWIYNLHILMSAIVANIYYNILHSMYVCMCSRALSFNFEIVYYTTASIFNINILSFFLWVLYILNSYSISKNYLEILGKNFCLNIGKFVVIVRCIWFFKAYLWD